MKKKLKIIVLTVTSIFFLNSCAVLSTIATVGAVTYLGGWIAVGVCTEFPTIPICSSSSKPETPAERAKREEKERVEAEKEKEKEKIKEEKEKDYIQEIISRKKQHNVEIFENIYASMPEKLEFKRIKIPEKMYYGNVVSKLYDKKTEKNFPKEVVIIEKGEKDYDKVINNEIDEKFEKAFVDSINYQIEKEIENYEKYSKKYPDDDYYTQKLEEYRNIKKQPIKRFDTVEKIGDNTYIITSNLNYLGEKNKNSIYLKRLKEGVYIVGNAESADIFQKIFGN